MVYVNDINCNGCGECVDVCPTGALVFQNKRAFIDQELCQGCEVCMEVCPNGAILSGDWVPVSRDVIHMPETVSAQVHSPTEQADPIDLRDALLPAMGSILLWAGRELVPRLADLTLGYLDRKIQSAQSISTERREFSGASRASNSTRGYAHGRRRRRRKNRRFIN